MSVGKSPPGARNGAEPRTRHPIRAPIPTQGQPTQDARLSSPGTPAVLPPEKPAPQSLKAGGVFGAYQLLHRIARSGMSEAYLAQNQHTRQLVALKCLHAHLSDEGSSFRMFEREARLAELMWHPNLVRAIESGEQNGRHFLALEYVHGVDLRAVMKRAHARSRSLPVDLVALVGLGILAALHYAHELRSPNGKALTVVHRDVSPQNVILTWDGQVKLLDFGIARSTLQETRTDVSFVKGKIPYMSPEQCMGMAIDRRSDIFSLGSVLYELTTGRRPYRGRTDYEVMDAIVGGQVDAPSDYLDGYDPDMEAIVLRALEASPDFRFQTAREMAGALAALLDDRGLRPAPVDLKEVIEILFSDRVEAWKRAQKAGKSLNDFLAHVDWDDRQDNEAEQVPAPPRRRGQPSPSSGRLRLTTSPLPTGADPDAKTADFDRKAVAKLASYARPAPPPAPVGAEPVPLPTPKAAPEESEPLLPAPAAMRTVRPSNARPPAAAAAREVSQVSVPSAAPAANANPHEAVPVPPLADSEPDLVTPVRPAAVSRARIKTPMNDGESPTPSGPDPRAAVVATPLGRVDLSPPKENREPPPPQQQREPTGSSKREPTGSSKRDPSGSSKRKLTPAPFPIESQPPAESQQPPVASHSGEQPTLRSSQRPLALLLVGTACALAIVGANYLSWKAFSSPPPAHSEPIVTAPWVQPQQLPPTAVVAATPSVDKPPIVAEAPAQKAAVANPAVVEKLTAPAAQPVDKQPAAPVAPTAQEAPAQKVGAPPDKVVALADKVAAPTQKALAVALGPVVSKPNPALSSPLAKKRMGKLRVKTNVRCMVSIDGNFVGRTPFSVDLAPGTHTLRVANFARHIDHSEAIRIRPRISLHRNLRFKPH